ncbi:MAG TPA: homocysteine S-methyltransferase family protein [Thermoflexales bacterium]|nr:homocysteine S-methyltransferase family protein [Thermoflexales bacterium]HQW33931.1 homocysteine S-methyltransferase family protein [Thermoflexales bacterium]
MIILDGALGTELTRRGENTNLPLWSARALMDAPQVVAQIHADYLAAGAEVLTANTFRTNFRTFEHAGLPNPHTLARDLTFKAVALAKNAGNAKVAGSLAPLEDCYTPELVPDDETLAREHAEHAINLSEAGCDLILVETMNTIREAVAGAKAAAQTGKPIWVSFTLNKHNDLISGEKLADAVQAVLPFNPQAILVNCIPVAQIAGALRVLRRAAPAALPIGAYGNVGHVDDVTGWTLTHAVTPSAYAQAAQEWRKIGATIIGGCCGTTPAHIEALKEMTIDDRRWTIL